MTLRMMVGTRPLCVTVVWLWLCASFVALTDAVELSQLLSTRTASAKRNGGGIVIRSGEDVVGMVASVWDDIVAKHQDGLLDPKAKSSAVSAQLTPQEALYHYRAAKDGIIDSARFLVTFGVASALSETEVARSPLLKAIADNDVDQVRRLLDEGNVDPNDVSADSTFKSTPLHFAVSLENRTEIIQGLVDHDADVEARASHGATPLMIAAALNNVEAIRVLVEKGGASISASHSFAKTTALHFAAEMGNVKAIDELCRLKGDSNINEWRTSSRGTALHTAADSNRPEAVKALVVSCQADLNALLNGDTTPLYLAAQRGFLDIIKTLGSLNADLNYVMPRETEFSKAKAKKNQHLVPVGDSTLSQPYYDYLNKNSETGNGATALHAACENGHLEAVDALLLLGAKQLNSMEGTSPLVLALQYRHPEIGLRLLKGPSEPKVNARTNRDGAFALFTAAGAGYDSVVDALLSKKDIDVNLRNFANASSLSHAIYRGHLQIARKLLQSGAQVRKQEVQALLTSQTALDTLPLVEKIVNEFASHADAADINGVLQLAAGLSSLSSRQDRVLHYLLGSTKSKLNLFLIDQEIGASPLHVAAQAGNLPVLKLMIEALESDQSKRRAAANFRGEGKLSGATMIYLAASENHLNVVMYLLETLKSNPSLGVLHDGLEVPPLFVAAEKGFTVVVEALLKHGPSKMRTERCKLGPESAPVLAVEVAAAGGHEDIVKLLMSDDTARRVEEAMLSISSAVSYSQQIHPVIDQVVNTVISDTRLDESRIQQMTRLLLGQRELKPSSPSSVIPRNHRDVLSAVKRLLPRWSTVADKLPFSPFHAAIVAYVDADDGESQALEFVEALLGDRPLVADKAFRQVTSKSRMTPLALAVEAQRSRMVKEILQAMSSLGNKTLVKEILDTKNAQGDTPMDAALRLRDMEIIKLLDTASASLSDEL